MAIDPTERRTNKEQKKTGFRPRKKKINLGNTHDLVSNRKITLFDGSFQVSRTPPNREDLAEFCWQISSKDMALLVFWMIRGWTTPSIKKSNTRGDTNKLGFKKWLMVNYH